ncbi:MAG TPA: hypothetical protein DIW64_14210 [Cellvibrio sp.]|nr:hypothetical protein [Cellvibrio sp.]
MTCSVKKLKNFTYHGHYFDLLYVILDENGSPPILPLLYTTYLCRFGEVFELKVTAGTPHECSTSILESREVSDKTIRAYVYALSKFLSYLDLTKKSHSTQGAHGSSACSDKFVNFYINTILSQDLEAASSNEVHRASLSAYFNWLDYFAVKPRLELRTFRITKQKLVENSKKENYIQYVTKYNRTKLINVCVMLSEKLMMRMGFEVGLRSSELTGLVVSGKGKLLELFEKLTDKKFLHHHEFSYFLEGKYTKGGVSRWIYFDRILLTDMKRYFDTERKSIVKKSKIYSDKFFLRRDRGNEGEGIGSEQASRVFRKRSSQAGLNKLLHFHDLRHTFATELFHRETSQNGGRENRSESAALIVVAQRLGHKFTKSGHAPAATTRYIRAWLQMQELEA